MKILIAVLLVAMQQADPPAKKERGLLIEYERIVFVGADRAWGDFQVCRRQGVQQVCARIIDVLKDPAAKR